MKTAAFIIAIAAVFLCFVFFAIYERKNTDVKKIMLITVMTSMSVAGRIIFAAAPGFKPVTAVVIITGMYLGAEAGFYCGALTALITNFYFGQGAFTPFQMLTWGLIGIFAGFMGGTLKKHKYILFIYGIFAGAVYSFIMDAYSVIWLYGKFSLSAYIALISAALPFTVVYAVSNVIFLAALSGTVGKKIEHASFCLKR